MLVAVHFTNFLCSFSLSETHKIKAYKTIVLPRIFSLFYLSLKLDIAFRRKKKNV
jgi:hypothetical protein